MICFFFFFFFFFLDQCWMNFLKYWQEIFKTGLVMYCTYIQDLATYHTQNRGCTSLQINPSIPMVFVSLSETFYCPPPLPVPSDFCGGGLPPSMYHKNECPLFMDPQKLILYMYLYIHTTYHILFREWKLLFFFLTRKKKDRSKKAFLFREKRKGFGNYPYSPSFFPSKHWSESVII